MDLRDLSHPKDAAAEKTLAWYRDSALGDLPGRAGYLYYIYMSMAMSMSMSMSMQM